MSIASYTDRIAKVYECYLRTTKADDFVLVAQGAFPEMTGELLLWIWCAFDEAHGSAKLKGGL